MVDRIKKNSSSETMITCMYKAVHEIQTELLYPIWDNSQMGIAKLKGLTFVLLTDETVFKTEGSGSTFKDMDKVIVSGNAWIYNWNNSPTNDNKFPTTIPGGGGGWS
jgi:hypothetical protein